MTSAAEGAEPESLPVVTVVVISKDEPALGDTLDALAEQVETLAPGTVREVELLVVDASSRRLDSIRVARPAVTWIDFERPEGVRISIPHQRNRGVRAARGETIVFIDCGCLPEPGWLGAVLAPILAGDEKMTCGQTGATGHLDPHRQGRSALGSVRYLDECPTINLAFRRSAFDEIGGFDETFEYGSDVDFSWRAVHRGVRIRYVHDAVVLHDWGTRRRQVKRSYAYGKARARLYAKHVFGHGEQSIRKRRLNERDAVPVMYPLYLLGLPIVLKYRSYLLLLIVPLWKNRHERPFEGLLDHVVLAAGVLAGTAEIVRSRRAGDAGA